MEAKLLKRFDAAKEILFTKGILVNSDEGTLIRTGFSLVWYDHQLNKAVHQDEGGRYYVKDA